MPAVVFGGVDAAAAEAELTAALTRYLERQDVPAYLRTAAERWLVRPATRT